MKIRPIFTLLPYTTLFRSEQCFDVANARHIVDAARAVGEESGRENRKGRVFVAGGPDRAREGAPPRDTERRWHRSADRKSTRLNSSHANTSYAVFCLKKIIETQLLEDRSRQHHALEMLLVAARQLAQGGNPAKYLLAMVAPPRIHRTLQHPRKVVGQPAAVTRECRAAVVQNDQQVSRQRAGMVQRLEGRTAGDFFFGYTSPTEFYTLSLHDALPI